MYNAVSENYIRLLAETPCVSAAQTDEVTRNANAKIVIEKLCSWCICSKHTINNDKTYLILFHKKYSLYLANRPINMQM